MAPQASAGPTWLVPAVLIFSSVGVGVRSDCTTDLSAVCSAIDAEDCEEPWLAEKCCATCANPGGQSCSRDSWTSLTQSMREHEVFIFNLPSAAEVAINQYPVLSPPRTLYAWDSQ